MRGAEFYFLRSNIGCSNFYLALAPNLPLWQMKEKQFFISFNTSEIDLFNEKTIKTHQNARQVQLHIVSGNIHQQERNPNNVAGTFPKHMFLDRYNQYPVY